jgi:hypothetical protein
MLLLVVAPACDSDSPVEPTIPPPPEPTVRLLVGGEARVLDCARGEPASGDGHCWCAIYWPVPGGEARAELWVVDVSRALAGEPVPCDGSRSSCLRMTDRLWGDRWPEGDAPTFGYSRFEGDTLLFLTQETTDPNLEYTWAWRPGWSRPRAHQHSPRRWCTGSGSGQYAYCFDNPADGTLDLRAGRLTDQTDSLLPLVDRVSQNARARWSASSTRADELLVYSTFRQGEAAQALRVIPAAELGRTPARTVVAGVEEWELSGDGQTVFYRHDHTAADYQVVWNQLRPAGFRPISACIYGPRHAPLYAAVFAKRQGPNFVAIHGADAAGLQSFFNEKAALGYSPTILSATGPANDAVFLSRNRAEELRTGIVEENRST